MGFYEQISRYYDYIFPASQDSLNFYKGLFKKHDVHSVLDVACGTGNYLVAFSQWGMDAMGVDLDPAMVAAAKQKAQDTGTGFPVMEADMRNLGKEVQRPFQAVICMGNSFAHLSSITDMEKAAAGFAEITEKNGLLIIQIVNYDRVLKDKVTELPTIENQEANLRFVRKYKYDAGKNLIHFQTHLQVGDEEYQNSIPLYPLQKDDLESIMKKAGYRQIEFYGNFKGGPWNDRSFATIATGIRV